MVNPRGGTYVEIRESSSARTLRKPRPFVPLMPCRMTTTLSERSAEIGPADGGVPARRAILRWAWRLFRREWRQQLLVLVLLAVAVAASIVGAAVGTNTPAPGKAIFGTANTIVSMPGSESHLLTDVA